MNRAQFRRVGGGCINYCFAVESGRERFFLKLNDARKFPGMFGAEARGLNILHQAGGLQVPEVLAHEDSGSGLDGLQTYGIEPEHLPVSFAQTSFLLLEWISSTAPTPDHGEQLGRMLAGCHAHSGPLYGLDHRNYIGSIPQSNRPHAQWASFYAEERVLPLAIQARDKELLSAGEIQHLERFLERSGELFSQGKPCLLHGDLWSGNIMFGPKGEPVFVDPAVYYGHPLMDIAMSRLFGGFPDSFYGAYHEIHPMPAHYHQALEAATIYPLLVHLLLFGSGYKGQVMEIIRKY